MQRHLAPIEIFDWYDGIVLAIVRASWREGFFLASILSWSQESRQRAFALLSVTQQQADEISRVAGGEEWESFLAYVKGLYGVPAADILAVCLDETRDEIVYERKVELADVKDDVAIDIQEAMDPKRARWLHIEGGAE